MLNINSHLKHYPTGVQIQLRFDVIKQYSLNFVNYHGITLIDLYRLWYQRFGSHYPIYKFPTGNIIKPDLFEDFICPSGVRRQLHRPKLVVETHFEFFEECIKYLPSTAHPDLDYQQSIDSIAKKYGLSRYVPNIDVLTGEIILYLQ